jgi:hypothetical protein
VALPDPRPWGHSLLEEVLAPVALQVGSVAEVWDLVPESAMASRCQVVALAHLAPVICLHAYLAASSRAH